MSDLPSEKHPVTPEMLDAAKNAREGWLRFQDDLLDRIARAEAAAEEARRGWKAENEMHERHHADLAEARQELERSEAEKRNMTPGWVERWAYDVVTQQRDKAASDLAEARQEREEIQDRATAAVDSMVAIVDAKSARIGELEAALREIEALEGGYPDDYAAIARAALQPTTEAAQEEGTP